jgi:hypothetical protein
VCKGVYRFSPEYEQKDTPSDTPLNLPFLSSSCFLIFPIHTTFQSETSRISLNSKKMNIKYSLKININVKLYREILAAYRKKLFKE